LDNKLIVQSSRFGEHGRVAGFLALNSSHGRSARVTLLLYLS
jgi:hypothetical protein